MQAEPDGCVHGLLQRPYTTSLDNSLMHSGWYRPVFPGPIVQAALCSASTLRSCEARPVGMGLAYIQAIWLQGGSPHHISLE